MIAMIVACMHLLFKKQFETPKETILRYIESGELPPKDTYTYAGRLDPLASGVLVVLDETSVWRREEILSLPKTYEVEVLFGVSTDSFDLLGTVHPVQDVMTWHTLVPNFEIDTLHFDKKVIDEKLIPDKEVGSVKEYDWSKLKGSYTQYYPFFSSKPIDGIPLFEYSKIHGIGQTNEKLPTRIVEIYDIEKIEERIVSMEDLEGQIEQVLSNVKGDFRQDEVKQSWEKYIELSKNNTSKNRGYVVMKFRLNVSSGFYVRSFACWLGQKYGVGAIALSIKRTSVGEYTI
ncbi:MAG: tRNA pseudouridine synthase tRNA pseudouridine55 synthase [Candidatus Parcubacteria bacterium]|jgi:tRNA U55 pseudouridine synthase TruB